MFIQMPSDVIGLPRTSRPKHQVAKQTSGKCWLQYHNTHTHRSWWAVRWLDGLSEVGHSVTMQPESHPPDVTSVGKLTGAWIRQGCSTRAPLKMSLPRCWDSRREHIYYRLRFPQHLWLNVRWFHSTRPDICIFVICDATRYDHYHWLLDWIVRMIWFGWWWCWCWWWLLSWWSWWTAVMIA